MGWTFWQAGAAIGIFVVAMLCLTGNTLGVSSGFGAVCSRLGSRLTFFQRGASAEAWRFDFTVGIPLGALLASVREGTFNLTWSIPGFPLHSPTAMVLTLFAGGTLIGYGARWAGGCTSGHGIVGMAQGAWPSIVTTCGFMAGGFAITWVLGVLGR